MMTQAFPPGMGPGHPAMGGHGHPMAGMQHAGGPHMGGPGGPTMMQGMHPGVSGPQVTQGPMVTGMPPGPGTPAPGPMQTPMAMAHLGPQQHIFQQGNPQMNYGQMPMSAQQQAMMRQQMMQRYQQQQQGVMPIGMPNGVPNYNQAQQLAQIKMNMPMQQQLQIQAHQNAQRNIANQQHQQQLLQVQAQQQVALAQQRQASHQMQISRSQEQPASQPPQPQPTPAPQNQPQPQSQPTPQSQPPTSQPTKAPAPPPTANNQQQNQPTQQVKQTESDDEPQIKQQDAMNPMMMQDIPKEQIFPKENAILRLILFQDSLANPQRPKDLDYWDEVIRKFFSPFGVLKHQVPAPDRGGDKTYQLQYPSLARYFQAHFVNGIKQILLQSYEHLHANRSNGETSVTSPNASLTYVFHDDVRVSTQGSLTVLFDEANRIIRLDIAAGSWTEYLPRSVLVPTSPEQGKEGKNKTKKNQAQPSADQTAYLVPPRPVGPWGVPEVIIGWLEIAEIINHMAPLIEYHHSHAGVAPREAMMRIMQEHQQHLAAANNNRMQNQVARAANGQVQFPPTMNGPNQFASPAMAHLGLPQAQGSPHIGGSVHTPSPAQNAAGGVSMMHQISAQGSNLSGSQGPSTNTSPNVSQKRRRASQIKLEEENASQDSNNAGKVKPSPRMTKRQKGL